MFVEYIILLLLYRFKIDLTQRLSMIHKNGNTRDMETESLKLKEE